VTPLLSAHHRVIVYDRRGYSRSGSEPSPIRGYLEKQAEDAAMLLQGLNAIPATVVGWSMGGVIALLLALAHPELISRLVVCEPPLHVTKHMPLANLLPFAKAMLLSAIGRQRQAAATFLRMSLAKPDGSNGYDGLDAATREGILVNAATLLHELKTGSGEELTPQRLQALRCPISAIIGDQTGSVFVDATERLSKMLPQMPIVRVPGAGHLIVMTHGEEFAREVLSATGAGAPVERRAAGAVSARG